MSRVRITLKEFIERLRTQKATAAQVIHFTGVNPNIPAKIGAIIGYNYFSCELIYKDAPLGYCSIARATYSEFCFCISNERTYGQESRNQDRLIREWVDKFIKPEFAVQKELYINEQETLAL